MKIVRTLFVGCAAVLLAVGATRAAEPHGIVKPLDRAKSCNTYGAGFRRVPGSDLCMKIGGWVRAQSTARGGSVNWKALNTGDLGTGTAAASARGYVTTDVHEPTGYGTVRAYLSVGVNGE